MVKAVSCVDKEVRIADPVKPVVLSATAPLERTDCLKDANDCRIVSAKAIRSTLANVINPL